MNIVSVVQVLYYGLWTSHTRQCGEFCGVCWNCIPVRCVILKSCYLLILMCGKHSLSCSWLEWRLMIHSLNKLCWTMKLIFISMVLWTHTFVAFEPIRSPTSSVVIFINRRCCFEENTAWGPVIYIVTLSKYTDMLQ